MSKARRCLAIDPGVTGAAALVEKNPNQPTCSVLQVWDLPTITETTNAGKTRRRLDPVALDKLLGSIQFDFLVVERLVAPPGIHSITAFSLGQTSGVIQAIASLGSYPLRLVSANVWKRGLDVSPDKAAARRHATRYFGHDQHWPRASHHNRAEAALIGAWALAQVAP